VPGAATLWPDGTQSQINRISDVGFQTNKVIPKQASDIIVAFFPIDRFLTPTFRQLFLDNPAGFFVPGELLTDPKTKSKLTPILGPLFGQINPGITVDNIAGVTMAAFQAKCQPPENQPAGRNQTPVTPPPSPAPGTLQLSNDQKCQLQDLFNRVSLNSVRVVVGGVMSVDVAAVPATIQDVKFNDLDKNSSVLWTTLNTERQVTISGVYLGNGTPYVVDASGKPIAGIKIEKVANSSTDSSLVFKMTLTKCIAQNTQVFVVVAKQPSNGSSDGSGKQSSDTDTTTAQSVTQSADTQVPGVISSPFLVTTVTAPCSNNSQNGDQNNAASPNTQPQATQPQQ
jgi:hypothetical protein